MFTNFIKGLRRVTKNPYLNLFIGLIFLYSGISEMMNELKELDNFRFGVHHGVILFALLHILKIVPDIFEGFEYIENVED
ncbi:MAG: hypothetical protein KAJ49_10945 [Arcobacteraceae bacterium]|nr:hypothetical protein [Arcobacteraceae bacterium]